MEKIIHISNIDLDVIQRISKLGDSQSFENPIETDFHYNLFSKIFMSGAEFIELDLSLVDDKIKNNPFYKKKLIDIDWKTYIPNCNKASGILLPHNINSEDGFPKHPQNIALSNYLTSFIHASETGIPFVIGNFINDKDFKWIEKSVSKELYQNLLIFNNLINRVELDTISPKQSVLKKEIKIFEDITTTNIYRDYQNSHNELKFAKKKNLIIKDIKVYSLKLYYKYLGNFDIRKSTFGALRTSNEILQSSSENPALKYGDIVVDLIEHLTSGKKAVNFYSFDEANYSILLNKRLDAILEKNGKEALNDFLQKELIRKRKKQ